MRSMAKTMIALLMIMMMTASLLPVNADRPIWNGGNYPTAMDGKHGSVTGRVTTSVNGTVGIGGAYIAIVNASNTSEEYYNTTSDMNGNYQVTGINATYSSEKHTGSAWLGGDYDRGINAYKMYASKDPYGEGYSAAFGIDENLSAATTTSIIIFTRPARIELHADRGYVTADGNDNILITATMYDALGNPVADGYNINFTVGNTTNNSFMPGSFPWAPSNGSLNGPENNVSLDNTQDNTGSASVQFGWVDNANAGTSSTVWAYWYDSDNPAASAAVHASIKINFNDIIKNNFNAMAAPSITDVSVNRTSIGPKDDIKVSYTLSNAGINGYNVYLLITDPNGVSIKTVDTGIQYDGPHDVVWDGCFGNGTHVPNGNYLLKIAVHNPEGIPGQLNLIKQYEYTPEPVDVAIDSMGNVIVADIGGDAVKRIYPNGTTRSIGSGFYYPDSVAVDSQDNVYVADWDVNVDDSGNSAIKMIYPNGTIKTIGAGFSSPAGIDVDSKGNVYVADRDNNAIKMIYPNGTIITLSSGIVRPYAVAVDESGNVYVTQNEDGMVKEIYVNNTVRTLPFIVSQPEGVAVDSHGNVYVTDSNDNSIKVLYANNTVRTFYTGPAWLLGLEVDSQDNVYVADAGYGRVLEIYTNGSTRTFMSDLSHPNAAVRGANDDIYVTEYAKNDIKVIHSNGTVEVVCTGLNNLAPIDIDASGNLYVIDSWNNLIRVVHPDRTISTIGSGFKSPSGVAVDSNGNVYVADPGDNAIKMIYPNNTTITLKDIYYTPSYIDVDRSGNLYVVNYDNERVEELYPNGTIRTLGNGYSMKCTSNIVAVDDSGNVYVANINNNTIDVILPDENIISLDSEYLYHPFDISIDATGNLLIIDANAVSEFASPSIITSDPIGFSVTGISPISFTYHLNKGWSLISIPVVPEDGNLTKFFSPIMSNVSIVWEYNSSNVSSPWAYYTTMTDKYQQGSLRSVNERQGYWVRCNSDTVFTVTGYLPQNSNVTLNTGWNLIGNPTKDVRMPLSTYPNEKIVWGYNSSNASSPWAYHTTMTDKYQQGGLTRLEPGYGYWVRI